MAVRLGDKCAWIYRFGVEEKARGICTASSSNWGCSALAAGGVVSERDVQREERWKSDAYKIYARNNTEDPSQVPSKLAKEATGFRDNQARIRSGANRNGSGRPRIWRILNDRGLLGELGHPGPYSRPQTRGLGEGVIHVLHGVISL